MPVATFSAAWACVLLGILHTALVYGTSEQPAIQQTMEWIEAADEKALCNDRSRAGFFMSRNLNSNDSDSKKWVIFLESGSLCLSDDTCNRRFFNPEVSLPYCWCILKLIVNIASIISIIPVMVASLELLKTSCQYHWLNWRSHHFLCCLDNCAVHVAIVCKVQ